jgi:hypothetical protein
MPMHARRAGWLIFAFSCDLSRRTPVREPKVPLELWTKRSGLSADLAGILGRGCIVTTGEPSEDELEDQRAFRIWSTEFTRLARAGQHEHFTVDFTAADFPGRVSVWVQFAYDVPSFSEADRMRAYPILWKHESPAEAYAKIILGRDELMRDLGYQRYLKAVG